VNARVERLRAMLEQPLLVTDQTNVYYLTGFRSSNAALLVEPDRLRLFADFRYAAAARALDGVEFEETERALVAGVARRIEGRVGFEAASVPYAGYETLRESGLELVPTRGVVEELRAVKDEQELATIRAACELTDRVYERLAEEPFVGRSERDVAWTMTMLFHDQGAEGEAFEPHVLSGPNGATPHGHTTDRTIERGETVVVDAGCRVDGYVSDYTRTFATGPLDGELKEAYEVVAAAQQAALDGIRAGLSGVDADALARGVVDDTRFAGTFGHGLGHGIGLLVHEAPRMSTESNDVLAAGNVVTVEPGIYLDGLGGIRIEDDVVVTDGGIENLTGFRKDLITVD
jgi:Xaa-Pro aminopeptidase